VGCSADNEFAAEGSELLGADATDRAHQAFARIISSSPRPTFHPNALRGAAVRCQLKGRRRPPRSPIKRVLPRVVLCQSSRGPSQSLAPSEPPRRFNRTSHSVN